MSVVEWLEMLGGVATRGALIKLTCRRDVDRALASGDIVRDARGRYSLPGVDEGRRLAAKYSGVLCLTSAALHHGWEVKEAPPKPHVCVPKWRGLPATTQDVVPHVANLLPEQIDGIATSVETTLTDCMRRLPWDEALAIVDSARRHGVPQSMLDRIADRVRGPGSPQVRRLAAEANPEAANPFESVLRSIALDVPGLSVIPQVSIRESNCSARPDLVDESLRLVLEADSFEWHGGRAELREDAKRYNLLVINGWIVLRFAWEDVMHDQDYVREVLVAAVALAEVLTEVIPSRPPAA